MGAISSLSSIRNCFSEDGRNDNQYCDPRTSEAVLRIKAILSYTEFKVSLGTGGPFYINAHMGNTSWTHWLTKKITKKDKVS